MRGKQWANREKKKSLDTYSTTWINHGSSLKWYFLPSFARKPESRATREIFLNTSEHGRLINSRSCIHPLPSPLPPRNTRNISFPGEWMQFVRRFTEFYSFLARRSYPGLKSAPFNFRITSIHNFSFSFFYFHLCLSTLPRSGKFWI